MNLRKEIKDHFFAEQEAHEKKSFWPTDSEKPWFDIYHAWMGTKPTNPMTPETRFGLGMRKKLEDAVMTILDNMKVTIAPEDGKQHRVEMTRLGIPITGYMDGLLQEKDAVVPLEIKTSFGHFNKTKLENGTPNTAYLKQLAMYMDFVEADKGYLFQTHFIKDLLVDDIYQFTITRKGNIFTCNNVSFDITDTYKRYKFIYDHFIKPKIEPFSEYRYKFPLDKIDWKSLAKSKIGSMRTGKSVYGDWQCAYSNYKNLIAQKEGSALGYTDEELEYIKDMTKGYTSKAWLEETAPVAPVEEKAEPLPVEEKEVKADV